MLSFVSQQQAAIGIPMATAESMIPGSPNAASPSGSFLPSYLTGDAFTVSSPRIWSVAGSPTKQRPNPSIPMQQSLSMPVNSPTTRGATQTPRTLFTRQGGDKPGGPPVQSLFENSQSPITESSWVSSPAYKGKTSGKAALGVPDMRHGDGILTPNMSYNQSKTSISPAQIDPFYAQGEALHVGDELDETWVTVFGFPVAAASYVLHQFSQYGTIIDHKVASNGNWIHIRYQSKLQAKKAISKNGKVLGGSIMIGVKPCIEKSVMNETGKENSFWPGLGSQTKCDDSADENATDWKSRLNIRPLTQAYKTLTSDHEVSHHNRTPQKSNNLMSKALDYVFGW